MNTSQTKRISKFLSLVLRHQPETLGIVLDDKGWTDVKVLIAKMGRRFPGFDFETLAFVVESNDKKRFSFNQAQTMIRASQGHSVKVALDYEPVLPPEILLHGTVGKFLAQIQSTGLKKMSRHHVHLSKDLETASTVGTRRGVAVILKVKSGEMHREGFEFFLSANGVWLTDHVPVKYIVFPGR